MRYTLFFFFQWFLLSAQKNDHTWLLGQYANQDTSDNFCVNILEFSGSSLDIARRDDIVADFNVLSAAYCNGAGELLAYSDGRAIYNKHHGLMQNGSGLNFNEIYTLCPQSVVMLNHPGSNDNKIVLLHTRTEYVFASINGLVAQNLYYSVIDVMAANGQGKVVEKNKLLVSDTLTYGKVCASRHGNGRDWWILVNEYGSNRFYTLLLDPTGLHIYMVQSVGQNIPSSLGQACFSPDGSLFATAGAINASQGSFLDLYDFDRCTGVLSNHRRHNWGLETEWAGGVAFSPNNRFLYVSANWHIFQYDLWASDWISSRQSVAYYDGFQSPLPTRFFAALLAPDDRIYVSCINAADVLHVINAPNELGYDCDVVQHGIELGCYNFLALPNYPHYRLYDMEGSSCDTLGINGPISAVKDQVAGITVNVFPNPATTELRILANRAYGDAAQFRLYTGAGTLVREVSFEPSGDTPLRVPVSDLPPGIYYYQVWCAGGLVRADKVVVVGE